MNFIKMKNNNIFKKEIKRNKININDFNIKSLKKLFGHKIKKNILFKYIK